MVHRKTFVFKNTEGTPFAVSFVADSDGKLKVKSFGWRAFHNNDFTDVFTINATTEWLANNGNIYIKRLPIPCGGVYNERLVRAMLKNYR